MEKASYRQVQNESKTITEVIYPKLAKDAKKLINNLLDYL